MSAPGLELVLAQAKALLIAGMTAKAAALNAEYGDDYAIAAPNGETGYYAELEPPSKGDLAKLSWPAVLVCPMQTDAAEPKVGNEYALAHGLVAVVLVRASSRAEQTALTLRTTRAVLELLCAQEALACGQCTYQGTDWRQREWKPSGPNYTLGSSLSGYSVTTYETP